MSGEGEGEGESGSWTRVLHHSSNFEIWAARESSDQVRVTVSLDDGTHIAWQEFWPLADFNAARSEDVVAQVIERCWPSSPSAPSTPPEL